MPVDPAQLSYVLSSIASAGKIMESAINLIKSGVRVNYEKEKSEADEYVSDAISKNEQEIRLLAMRIPKNILDAVSASIDAVNEEIAQDFRTAKMPIPEMEQRVEYNQRRICNFISQLSKFGKIPDTMQVIWDISKCADKGFRLN